jgi:hypothetical protein
VATGHLRVGKQLAQEILLDDPTFLKVLVESE